MRWTISPLNYIGIKFKEKKEIRERERCIECLEVINACLEPDRISALDSKEAPRDRD